MMTARERWLSTIEGRCPDRVPCDYWGTSEVTRRLMRHLSCDSERALWECLRIDKCIFLAPKHPSAKENTWHIPSQFSVWGIPTAMVPYMDGLGFYEEAVDPPLAHAQSSSDVEHYPWPDCSEWDAGGLRAECLRWKGYPIVGASYEPFYLYCRLRGMEQALEDLVLGSPVVDAAMERIYEIHAGIVRQVLDAAGDLIDFIYVAEDLGTQNSLLMSARLFRRYIKPWLAKMIELAHSRGVKAFHHDDGAIRGVLADLIEIGIDVLSPIQWRCRGMERKALVRDFGNAVAFHGGIDNQQTMPFGTPADVWNEVVANVSIFKKAKGYIVAPCHNLQANTPTANILALYEAVQELSA